MCEDWEHGYVHTESMRQCKGRKSGFPPWMEWMGFGIIPCKKKVPNVSVFLTQGGDRRRNCLGHNLLSLQQRPPGHLGQ